MSRRTDPEVSVVIPTRDRWPVLTRFGLRSALLQQGVSVEILVVDDGSSPSSISAPVAELVGDPRVRLIRHDQNLGQSAARNTGVREARGSWIAFLDDDDIWAPNRLVTMLDRLRRDTADFAYGAVLLLGADYEPVEVGMPTRPDMLSEALRHGCAIWAGASNVIASSELVRSVGEFDEELDAATDWDMWLRLARAGRATATDEILLAYKESPWLLRSEPDFRSDIMKLALKRPEMAVTWDEYEIWVASVFERAGRRRAATSRYLKAAFKHRDVQAFALAGRAVVGRHRVRRWRGKGSPASPAWLSLYVPPDSRLDDTKAAA